MYHDRNTFNDAPLTTTPATFENVAPLCPDQQPAPAKKARKPPKPGPSQRRADEPHRIPLNVGLKASDKMKFLRVIARDSRLTDAQKAVAIPLVDNVNSEKGHSFISWEELGKDSGLGWQTAQRAVERFKELEYVNVDHIQGEVVHVSLNLDKIKTPKPDRKQTLSRDEARARAAAKSAGATDEGMSSQTSPTQRHFVPSQRHMVPVPAARGAGSDVQPDTPRDVQPDIPEMYGATSEGMSSQTSKSEIPLVDVIQRSSIRDQNQNEGCATAAPPDRVRVSDDWEPAGKRRAFIPRDELGEAYQQITGAFLGNSAPIAGSTYSDHKGAIAGVLMQGFTVEQIVARMKPHNDRLLTMPEGKLHLLTFVKNEFGITTRDRSIEAPRAVDRSWDRDEFDEGDDRREERREARRGKSVTYGAPSADEEFADEL